MQHNADYIWKINTLNIFLSLLFLRRGKRGLKQDSELLEKFLLSLLLFNTKITVIGHFYHFQMDSHRFEWEFLFHEFCFKDNSKNKYFKLISINNFGEINFLNLSKISHISAIYRYRFVL